jgi:adenylate cyclase
MIRKILQGLLTSLIVIVLLSSLFYLGLFENWQKKLSDSLFTPRPASQEIVIVAIDNDSIQNIGRWPWKRSVHANLLTAIEKQKPVVVGFDVSFLEPGEVREDSQFSLALKKFDNVVLASERESGGKILQPISQFSQFSQTGFVNTVANPDGITRQAAMIENQGPETNYHFAIEILAQFFQKEPQQILNLIPFQNELVRINFIGQPHSFPTYSFVDVLETKQDFSFLKDKIVLIGATAQDLHDEQLTPTSLGSPMAGVEIQANIIQTILEKNFLATEQKSTTLLTIALLTSGLSLILLSLNLLSGLVISFLVLLGFLIYVISSFDQGVIRNVIYPSLAIILTTIFHIIYRYFAEFRQKRFLKKAFSYYLSPSVLKEILSDPKKLKLGGQRQKITVLFSDIAGFTSISEKTSPEKLTLMLNDYLTKMTKIVFHYRGVLDKFVGDSVMAFWGAPIKEKEQELLACKTALAMMKSVKQMKNFDIRIGINTGEMVVGNMGSESRFDYTVLGDNVNLGSRLESINKLYGTRVIISHSTFHRVKNKVIARKLDLVAVQGKKKGVTIYELRGLGKASGKESQFLQEFEKAWTLYHQAKFKQALIAFHAIAKKYPQDNPTKLYIIRCQNSLAAKPKKWDGVYYAQGK